MMDSPSLLFTPKRLVHYAPLNFGAKERGPKTNEVDLLVQEAEEIEQRKSQAVDFTQRAMQIAESQGQGWSSSREFRMLVSERDNTEIDTGLSESERGDRAGRIAVLLDGIDQELNDTYGVSQAAVIKGLEEQENRLIKAMRTFIGDEAATEIWQGITEVRGLPFAERTEQPSAMTKAQIHEIWEGIFPEEQKGRYPHLPEGEDHQAAKVLMANYEKGSGHIERLIAGIEWMITILYNHLLKVNNTTGIMASKQGIRRYLHIHGMLIASKGGQMTEERQRHITLRRDLIQQALRANKDL